MKPLLTGVMGAVGREIVNRARVFRLALPAAGFALFFNLATPCRAQWYAPDTECHDRAQRRFVVELSRVLAWRQNRRDPAAPKVAEVTYTVASAPDHRTSWTLRWHWQNMAFVIIHWLRNDLLEVPVPAEQSDLKPPGAQTLLEAYTKAAGE